MTRWLDAEQQQAWRAFLGAVAQLQSGLDAQLQTDSGMPHGY